MAEETGTGEQSLEQQLEAMISGSPADAGKPAAGAPPKAGEQQAAASPPAAQDPPADPLEAALDALEEKPAEKPGEQKPAEKPAEPQLSSEQQTILKHIPDVQTAVHLHQTAQNYDAFTSTFESGNYDNVVKMFETWNPKAFEGFLEHIYEKNIDEWTDRWVEEKEGRGTTNKELRELKQTVRQLQAKQNAPAARAPQQDNSNVEAAQRSFKAYDTFVDGLFTQIKFNETDRPYVKAALGEAVVKDPALLAAIRNGDLKVVIPKFKNVVRTYVNRDKQVKDGEAAKLALQNQKKPVLGGGTGGAESGELSDDINQVPKEKREEYLDQQLGKLFSKKK